MKNLESQLGLLKKETRRQIIEELVTYFKEERGEKIGVIAAERILDFFLDSAGKTAYNKGVKDSQTLLKQRLEDFDIDLEALIVNL